jgi:hypothetical protein
MINKYLVIDMKNQNGYLVSDITAVSIIVGVHRNTVASWFEKKRFYVHDYWAINKGYLEVKSRRGGFKKKEPEGS